uniref:Thioredoxin domain-containing protein n=3 Tax=Magallana gigas TaxID=29159 RepID=A0A8W8J4Q7_MAGGI|nr:thioredoxin, mitochondrial [Crassostrea gigas]|eukprot:XP_011420863.1 PREDICTED: thioredoxin, mitochondrial-like [Crassostrea gigas]
MSSRYILRSLRAFSKQGRAHSCTGFFHTANLSTALLRKAHHPHYPAVNINYNIQRHVATAEKKFECFNIQDAKDFQTRVIESPVPVIVDFHATWCGPCKLLGPRLEAIISNKEGQVSLAKVDVDENVEIAMEYLVESLPTVIGFKNGRKINKFIGLQEDDAIDSFVEKLIH